MIKTQTEVNGYKLLKKTVSPDLDTFIKAYNDKNIELCRVMNTSEKDPVDMRAKNNKMYYEIYLLKEDKKDFTITSYTKHFALSITDKMYSYEKNRFSIIYKKGKLYFSYGKKLTQVTVNMLFYNPIFTFVEIKKVLEDKIGDILEKLQYLKGLLSNISINTILSNKLFTKEDYYSYLYKTTYKVAKILSDAGIGKNFMTLNKKYLYNIEKLNKDLLIDCDTKENFFQLLNLAKQLNEKIDCAMTTSEMIGTIKKFYGKSCDIRFKSLPEEKLYVHPIMNRFASEYDKFEILTNKKEIIRQLYYNNNKEYFIRLLENINTFVVCYDSSILTAINIEQNKMIRSNIYYRLKDITEKEYESRTDQIKENINDFNKRYTRLLTMAQREINEIQNVENVNSTSVLDSRGIPTDPPF